MAVNTSKSVNITAIEAATLTPLDKKHGIKKVMIDEIELVAEDVGDIGDIILLAPVPSNAVITSIKLFNDDLDSNGSPALAANVGLYYSGNGNGTGISSGDVVDADCFATAITTLQSANVSGVDVRFEDGDIDNIDQEAWAVGGLSSDPGGYLYIGLTLTTAAATGAAGGIKCIVEYI